MSLKEYGIICENEPTYTKAEELIVVQFRNIFLKIKNMGFVKSHRSNNTGIGKTFEDLVGVQENNLQDADFMNFIEIKSKRKKSNSMLTLFTKSPEYPKDSNTYLREKYGVTEDGTGQKLLHTTITATEFNQFGDKYGFKVANCRTESEKQTAQGRACDEDTIDAIHHHNERGKKERGPAQKTEPAEEPDYDVEGMPPHN